MIAARKQRSKAWGQGDQVKQLSGIKCLKISNISCFVNYNIIPDRRVCDLKIYTRLRPGNIEY